MFGKRYPNCVKKENTQRKMSSLEMQQIILLAKAMKQMPGSPAQKIKGRKIVGVFKGNNNWR